MGGFRKDYLHIFCCLHSNCTDLKIIYFQNYTVTANSFNIFWMQYRSKITQPRRTTVYHTHIFHNICIVYAHHCFKILFYVKYYATGGSYPGSLGKLYFLVKGTVAWDFLVWGFLGKSSPLWTLILILKQFPFFQIIPRDIPRFL